MHTKFDARARNQRSAGRYIIALVERLYLRCSRDTDLTVHLYGCTHPKPKQVIVKCRSHSLVASVIQVVLLHLCIKYVEAIT